MSAEYQVALVTGAGSGLGRALALTLAGKGIAIAALDRRPHGLTTLGEEIRALQGRYASVVGDVTDAAGLRKNVAELESVLGPIDLLLANAGIGLETSALDYQAEAMNAVLNVNLLGVSNSLAAVLPGMLLRRRGHLVAISSMASYRGLPRMIGYCASKAGVNALMEGVRLEVAQRGLHVTTICPGWIRTPLTATLLGNLPYLLEADDAARRIVAAIFRKKKFLAFPAGVVWQMRILNCLPGFLRDRVIGRLMRGLKRKMS